MGFELHVLKDGELLFNTSDGNIVGAEKLVELHDAISSKFPASEGYRVLPCWRDEQVSIVDMSQFGAV